MAKEQVSLIGPYKAVFVPTCDACGGEVERDEYVCATCKGMKPKVEEKR